MRFPDAVAQNPRTRSPCKRASRHYSDPVASQSPKLLLTPSLTFASNSSFLSLHIFAASTFAGLSSFGSANILITLIRIFSTLCIGLHRSDACSYWFGSSPGGCRIDIHTNPVGYTVYFLVNPFLLMVFFFLKKKGEDGRVANLPLGCQHSPKNRIEGGARG